MEKNEEFNESLNELVEDLKERGFEVSKVKSTLGGGDPTYFLKIFGPRETWTNNIALNSPFWIMLAIEDGVVSMSGNSYQVRKAKAKMRKTKYKDSNELNAKVKAYFDKNSDKIWDILSGEYT